MLFSSKIKLHTISFLIKYFSNDTIKTISKINKIYVFRIENNRDL